MADPVVVYEELLRLDAVKPADIDESCWMVEAVASCFNAAETTCTAHIY